MLVFLVSLGVPWILTVGPLSLPSPRLILLAMVLPCLAQWMTGRAGRIRAADIAILLFCLWCALSLVMVHGAAFAVQPAGMLFVETMGAYLLSRCYIRSADDFLNMARVLFRIVAFLFPFALIEALTGRNVLLELFTVILPSYPDSGLIFAAAFIASRLFSNIRSCSEFALAAPSPSPISCLAAESRSSSDGGGPGSSERRLFCHCRRLRLPCSFCRAY